MLASVHRACVSVCERVHDVCVCVLGVWEGVDTVGACVASVVGVCAGVGRV